MAQSLCDESISYCICLFGTDNKFDFKDVINRLKYIKDNLQENGVEMCGKCPNKF